MAQTTTSKSPASGTTVTLFPDGFIDLTTEKQSEINDDDDVVLIPNTPQTSNIDCAKYPSSNKRRKVDIESIQKSASVTETVQKQVDFMNQTRQLSMLPIKASNQLSQINFKSSGGEIMVERKLVPTVQPSTRSSTFSNNVLAPKREKYVAVISKTYSKQDLNKGAWKESLGNSVLQKKCHSVSCNNKELLKELIKAEEINKKEVVQVLDDVILLGDVTTKGLSKVIRPGMCNEKASKPVNESYIIEKSQQITNLKFNSKQSINGQNKTEDSSLCKLFADIRETDSAIEELEKELIKCERMDKKNNFDDLNDVILLSDDTTKAVATEEKVTRCSIFNEKTLKLVNDKMELERNKNAKFGSLGVVEKSQKTSNSALKLTLNTQQFSNRQNKTSAPQVSSPRQIIAKITESEKELIRNEEVVEKDFFDLDDVILLSNEATRAAAAAEVKVTRPSIFNEKTLRLVNDKIELKNKNARFDHPLRVVEKSQQTTNSSLRPTLNSEPFSNRQNKTSTPRVSSPRKIIAQIAKSQKELIRCEEVAEKDVFDDLDDVILLSNETTKAAAMKEKITRPIFNEKTLKLVNDKIELENNKNARFNLLQVVEKSQPTSNSSLRPTLNSEQLSNRQNKTSTPRVSSPRKIMADIAETASAVATITPNEGHCNPPQFSNGQNKTSIPQVPSPRQLMADITEAASAVAAITPNQVNYPIPSTTTTTSVVSTSAINDIINLSSPESAPEETTPAHCAVSSTDADFLKKPPTEDVEIEPPAAVTPVDIMKIINEGKASTLREPCGSEAKHIDDAPFKGFTKVERRKRSCIRELREAIKQTEAKMEELNKSVFQSESNFVNCGNSNDDFLPEVKPEMEELEEFTNDFSDIEERVNNEIYNTQTLPTITEVISQVNEEVLQLRKTQRSSNQDLHSKLAKPEQALKLIKEGLELIQSWSRESSSSKEKADVGSKVSDGSTRGRKKTVPVVEEEKTKKRGRRKKTEVAKQEVNQPAKKKGRPKKGESREQCDITNVTRKSERLTRGRKKRKVEGDDSDELLILKRVDILNGNGMLTPKRYKKKC